MTRVYDAEYYREYFRPGSERWERNLCRASARSARLRFGQDLAWEVFWLLRHQPCVTCGVTPSNGVDHIVPRMAGGRNVIENVQPMCGACNSRKGSRERRIDEEIRAVS